MGFSWNELQMREIGELGIGEREIGELGISELRIGEKGNWRITD
jgi:hypothetical protein